MSLTIVIGFDGLAPRARAFPVYVGSGPTCGSESRAAMEKSEAARFEVFSGVDGVPQSNPRVRAKVAAKAAKAEAAKGEKARGEQRAKSEE